ncbi:hypothetical protein N4G58_10075 [Edwardsiella piscicida]|nr:hypothetical protein N4G58_10075 [Edwardsiella piscicida]
MADIITRTFFAYGIEHFSAWGDFFQQQAHCGKIKINVHNDDFLVRVRSIICPAVKW